MTYPGRMIYVPKNSDNMPLDVTERQLAFYRTMIKPETTLDRGKRLHTAIDRLDQFTTAAVINLAESITRRSR